MSCWTCAKNEISIIPEVDDMLIQEYILFSKQACPSLYNNEKYCNTWFFNADNKLVSISSKFFESSIWFDFLKKYFFEPRGYALSSDAEIVGEFEEEYHGAEKKSNEEYLLWKIRKERLSTTINL